MTPSPRFDAFFEGLRAGEIRVHECLACGDASVTPHGFCPDCGADDFRITSIAAEGAVYSVTDIHVVSDPRFDAPLRVGIVELDAGPRLMARLSDDVGVDDRVELDHVDTDQERPVAVFAAGED